MSAGLDSVHDFGKASQQILIEMLRPFGSGQMPLIRQEGDARTTTGQGSHVGLGFLQAVNIDRPGASRIIFVESAQGKAVRCRGQAAYSPCRSKARPYPVSRHHGSGPDHFILITVLDLQHYLVVLEPGCAQAVPLPQFNTLLGGGKPNQKMVKGFPGENTSRCAHRAIREIQLQDPSIGQVEAES